jgi:hypothetical protein
MIIVEALPDWDFASYAIAASGAVAWPSPGNPDFLVTPGRFPGPPWRDLWRSNIGGQVLMKKAKNVIRDTARAGPRMPN